MRLSEIILIAGDTSRSRCYMQAMRSRDILPAGVAVLPSPGNKPGQIKAGDLRDVPCGWGIFKPGESVMETAGAADVPVVTAPGGDINSPDAIAFLAGLPAKAFIYSGFGGVLLRRETLSCGKLFLHVHGGWLPDYKGSTTNHYSALEAGFCGASAIFLSPAIDSGEILHRKRFPVPHDILLLDHVYDALFRAEALVETLEKYAATREWPKSGIENTPTQNYYIMHPVLRHALILREHAKRTE